MVLRTHKNQVVVILNQVAEFAHTLVTIGASPGPDIDIKFMASRSQHEQQRSILVG